jgi:hypothetical protein
MRCKSFKRLPFPSHSALTRDDNDFFQTPQLACEAIATIATRIKKCVGNVKKWDAQMAHFNYMFDHCLAMGILRFVICGQTKIIIIIALVAI